MPAVCSTFGNCVELFPMQALGSHSRFGSMSLLTSLAQLTSNCSYFAYISRALAEATYMKPIVARHPNLYLLSSALDRAPGRVVGRARAQAT